MPIEIDRSRIIEFQKCPRARYLAYHHLGTGLQRTRKSLPLQFGSAFHEGAEHLLQGNVEEAVLRAFLFLEQALNGGTSFDGEEPKNVEDALRYGREEQMALVEALLRGWHLYEGKEFLEQFEVMEVEREGRALLEIGSMGIETTVKLDGTNIHRPYDNGLTLMFRPDALVREKASGDLYVISWKTCSSFGKRNELQARHDMQSMSEVWGVQQTRAEELYRLFGSVSDTYRHRIEGVIYKWIVKGRRSLDKWDGLYKQNSHLIYGWLKRGDTPEMDEWSWAYEWEKEDGSGSSRLGKGWRKVPIWREYEGGVKAWIDDLHHRRVFPRHLSALASVFPVQTPVERRADEVESWRTQVVQQELEIADKLEQLRLYLLIGEPPKELLDKLFPQYTHSCHSFLGCAFLGSCWEGAPAQPGDLYQIRLSNHPEHGDDNE